jgi:sigma-B regulation protein RsbU (phosphoserine phosphatase)
VRSAARVQTIAYAVMAIVLLGRFAGKLQQWVDRRFFREQARAEQMLLDLSQQVRGVIEPARLSELVTETVKDALQAEPVELDLNGAGDGSPGVLKLPLEAGAKRLGWLVLGPKRNEEPFSRSEVRLLQNVAAQTALAMDNARLASAVMQETAQRERIQREIEICREVQERIFPQKKPVVAGLDYVGLYRPAETVGGDCFEYMVDEQGRLWLAIGDVAGKGVPAAFLMAGVNAALRGLLAAGVSDVSQVFNHLNRVLYDSTPKNRFVTLLLARFDPGVRRLVYASAGHCPLLLLRADGRAEWLTTRGIGLGLTGTASYQHAETMLSPGDVFLLYTDGVTEARNALGEDFGEDRLRQAAAEHRMVPAEELASQVVAAVQGFAGGAPQHDDITVLAARCVA